MKFTLTSKQYVDSLITEAEKRYIFRVEHQDSHQGPYQAKLKDGSKFDISKTYATSTKYNPAPAKDTWLVSNAGGELELNKLIKTGVFAFESLMHLKRWFGSDALKWLMTDVKEFQIVKKSIPANKVVFGETQCLVDAKTWSKTSGKIVKF